MIDSEDTSILGKHLTTIDLQNSAQTSCVKAVMTRDPKHNFENSGVWQIWGREGNHVACNFKNLTRDPIHEHYISTEINQLNECAYIKAQRSEAFIFPMCWVFPKASKKSGQPKHTSFDLFVCVQNEAGFQCIVTLLHLHAQNNQWNCNVK